MPIRFRFSLVPFIAAVIVVAIGVSLGQWQLRRAAEKRAIEAKWGARTLAAPTVLNAPVSDPEAFEYRKVLVKGEFDANWPVYLDNRPHDGAAGFYLLMPLKISGTDLHILVARGWLPRNASDRLKLPPIDTPKDPVELLGTIRLNPGHLLELGGAQRLRPASIVQNLSINEFAQASQMKMQPVMLEQLNDTHDGLVRDWPLPSAGVDKHLGYAFQWYALAATAFIFFLVTGFRRGAK